MVFQIHLLLLGFSLHGFKVLVAQIKNYAFDVSLEQDSTSVSSKKTNAIIIDFDNENLDEILESCKINFPDRYIIGLSSIAVIIDLDHENLDEKLGLGRKKIPRKHLVGLSSMPIELDKVTILKKPINQAELRTVLEGLGCKKAVFQEKTREIRAIYSDPESSLHYSIKNSFQEYLIRARKLHLEVKQPVELVFLSKPVLYIFNDKISTSLSKDQLKHLCTLTVQEHSISINLSKTPPHGLQSKEADYFISKIIAWSSRGRLPYGINSTDIVRMLPSEKEITLTKIKGSDSIKTLWAMTSCSLQKTEDVLEVSQASLFLYFSVMYGLDLIEVSSDQPPPNNSTKSKKKSSKSGWLGKFFSKKTLIPNSI
ncbi:MAG: hypothetical protein L3J59_07300 [Methylococcaceae bacterium]|nr:hypothetical protein [Methylococcaceae bacterium]